MARARGAKYWPLAGLALLCWGGWERARGDGCCCPPIIHNCPPPFIHYQEGPPCLKFKHACPKPVCDPCHLPHAGIYRPCWQPWPYPPDWSHCHVPPPSEAIAPPQPPVLRSDRVPGRPGDPGLVPPRKFDGKPAADPLPPGDDAEPAALKTTTPSGPAPTVAGQANPTAQKPPENSDKPSLRDLVPAAERRSNVRLID